MEDGEDNIKKYIKFKIGIKIEDITNFIFAEKKINELFHYDLLIINADWAEEKLTKDIRIMLDRNIIDKDSLFIICEGH